MNVLKIDYLHSTTELLKKTNGKLCYANNAGITFNSNITIGQFTFNFLGPTVCAYTL